MPYLAQPEGLVAGRAQFYSSTCGACSAGCGLLVPPNDSAALAAAMQKVLALSPAERAEMGRRGRGHVESRFGIDRVLDRWESIYHELLAKGGGRRCA